MIALRTPFADTEAKKKPYRNYLIQQEENTQRVNAAIL